MKDARRGGRRARPRAGLFRDIVLAPDREVVPDARPLVSVGDGEDADFLAEVRARAVERYELRRRGVQYGLVAELDPSGLVPPRPRRRRREALESERWVAAAPIFLPGMAESVRPALLAEDVERLFATLSEPPGLARFLAERAGRLAPRFRVVDERAPLFDPERDLARVRVACDEADDLWLKTGRLSTEPSDCSLRLRASFGVESRDDASLDEGRHGLVAELAQAIFPGARALAGLPELDEKLAQHVGAPVRHAQHIAYWNAPNGGARFHHDAFAEVAGGGQRGVVYAQLTGRTVWLALSIEAMAARTREFVRFLREGDMPWIRDAVGDRWSDVLELTGRRGPTLVELARPGCGLLGTVVDGPEFTTFLVDAGYALVLRPGDVLVLPNHGTDRTAMHSVFSGSQEPGYALSVALRDRESAG